ncbi:MAG: RNB domain-containing ribonuclease, partial [Deltaproteobacteria bacterium]|nr:RNB domain-containing ribonuclease [Deltaproteobacteria bacterium]
EFMLAANEAVAETLDRAGQQVLFRVHEKPDPTKVEGFTEAAQSLGLQLPKTEISPAWFARVLAEAHKSPAEYVVNNLLLRTMQRARYTPENLGHFGLAAGYYLHFTSPIRRYPDLVVHRVLQNFLVDKKSGARKKILSGATTLDEAGLFLSNRERVAVDVERNVQSRLSALFLRERVTEHFDAIISGVTSFGLFVELLEYFTSGAIPIKEMDDDYYIFDSRGHKLVGERTAKTYQLGSLIRVQLDHVDMITKRITFSIVDESTEDLPDRGQEVKKYSPKRRKR